MFRRFLITLILVLLLGLPFIPAAGASGGGNAGVWLEVWDSETVDYCPDTRYFVTPRNEPFLFTLMPGGAVYQVKYLFSEGPVVTLGQASNSSLIFTEVTSAWVHLIEAVPMGPGSYRVTSTFWRTDGSCYISNSAWWTYAVEANFCTAWAFQNGNRRSGAGTNNQVLGSMARNQWMQVVGKGFASDGVAWYLLSDNTWVSSKVAKAVGYCPY